MVFVDVGSNIGSHTLNAARLVGSTGSVFAFEADPDTYNLLVKNIEFNNLTNVTVKRTCVSDQVGTVSFYKHRDSAKSSIVDRGEKLSLTLPAEMLDNLIPINTRIDILKVDVEGAELNVLRGARRIFLDQRPPSVVIIEVFDVRDNTDKSQGFEIYLKSMAINFTSSKGARLTPFSGSALNAYALH